MRSHLLALKHCRPAPGLAAAPCAMHMLPQENPPSELHGRLAAQPLSRMPFRVETRLQEVSCAKPLRKQSCTRSSWRKRKVRRKYAPVITPSSTSSSTPRSRRRAALPPPLRNVHRIAAPTPPATQRPRCLSGWLPPALRCSERAATPRRLCKVETTARVRSSHEPAGRRCDAGRAAVDAGASRYSSQRPHERRSTVAACRRYSGEFAEIGHNPSQYRAKAFCIQRVI